MSKFKGGEMDFKNISEEEELALEELSDKVRVGEVIGFSESLIVIEYQTYLKKQRKHSSFLAKLKRFF